MTNPLLDIVQKLPRELSRGTGPGWTRSDHDYVSPTSREIELEFSEALQLQELELPKGFKFPFGGTKKALTEALEKVDPNAVLAERATLRRFLKAKKVDVSEPCSTVEMVRLVLIHGLFGFDNKSRPH